MQQSYRQVSYTDKLSTGAYVNSGEWILYAVSATVIQTGQLYRHAQHRGVHHQREMNHIRNECNSYTDRSVIQTGQLYRQVSFTDKSVIQTSSAQGLTSPAGNEPYTTECNSYTDRSVLCTALSGPPLHSFFNNLYTYNLTHWWVITRSYLGYGTRLVWNSVRSTLRAPSNLREAVMEDTIWLISLKIESNCISSCWTNVVLKGRCHEMNNFIEGLLW